ncbi:MAG: ferrous iron transport protein B [Chloroflexota bacterium]|nr:ferrous iron transport protein B [Chloroflexota bacterium]
MSITIAVAGNPNTGKSTLFNALTGLHQHTGNWPGKTVERKEGEFKHDGRMVRVVDLPGTYSLTAVSSEEIVARDFIVEGNPDAVIVIVDAANLERNLYLVLQVLELTNNVAVALNMMDQLESKGVRIDLETLSEQLGMPVIPIVALKKEGIPQLIETVMDICAGKRVLHPARVTFDDSIEQSIAQLEPLVENSDYPARWLAIKLLEGDTDVKEMLQASGNSAVVKAAKSLVEQSAGQPEVLIAEQRYELIGRIARRSIHHEDVEYLTDKIDDIVTHKILGLPILAIIAGVTLWAIYNIAGPIGGLFEQLFNVIIGWAGELLTGAPWWVSGIIVDGILLGTQQIFVFMFGVLVVFFFIYGILEDIGYLARGAFVMDRIMKWLGLPGKAFMTIFAGYGCSVAGVMGTRIIDDENDRIITAVVVPFIPCAARIAVITAIVPVFFGSSLTATIVTLGIFGLSLLIVALVAIILKKTVFEGEHSGLVMEMPDYHPPLLSNVLRTTWDRTYDSMSKALMIFVPFSIIIYLFFHLPAGAAVADSYGMTIGSFLDPIGKIIGLSGKDMTGFIFTYPAKELSLLYLGLSYGGVGEEAIAGFMSDVWTPLQAISYLVFLTLYAPCLATVAAMTKEIGWKWTWWNVIVSLIAGFGFASLIYWVGTLFGLG